MFKMGGMAVMKVMAGGPPMIGIWRVTRPSEGTPKQWVPHPSRAFREAWVAD